MQAQPAREVWQLANRNNVCEVASALFLLPIAGTKEKAKQKENAVEGEFRRLRAATEGSAFGNRKPLKRLEPNFKTGEKMKLVDLPADTVYGR